MNAKQIIPIQFQEKMIKNIEEYINLGIYSSKAEFIRESVRLRIIKLQKDLFFDKLESLRKLSKLRKANNKFSFISKEEKNSIAKDLLKRL